MRAALLVVAGCAAALVLVIVLLRSPGSAAVNGAAQGDASADSVANRSAASRARGQARPGKPISAAQKAWAERHAAARGARKQALPDSLSAAPMSDAARAELERFDAQDRELLDYKLGLLARLDRCLAGRIQDRGPMDFWLHYQVDWQKSRAVGHTSELRDSELGEESDQVFARCLQDAHQGAALRMTAVTSGQTEFHVSMRIQLPLEEDTAYGWFAE